jgi:hypothetical protein
MTVADDPIQLLGRLKFALAARDRAGANGAIAQLLATNASLGRQWHSLATLALHHGEIGLATRAMDRLVAAAGGSVAARQEQAVLLARAGRLEQAAAVLSALPASGDPGLRFTEATLALDLGDLARARALLLEVVAARPAAGSAWLALTMAGGARDPAVGDRLLAARAAAERAPAAERIAWHYAAGRVLGDRSQHNAAFAALSEGAGLRRAAQPYDAGADAAAAEGAIAGSDALPPAHIAGRAIVVTGLPRSGTTLVEQILASHSAVTGGSELNLLRLVAQDAGGVSAAAARRHGNPAALAALYDHLLTERFGPAGRVIDKTLDTSRYLGLLSTIAPGTPVIWVRRDPLDCAWSCFRTHFVAGAAWSRDLTDMAYHFRLEDRLHAHWSTALGSRLLTVPYEGLVTEPERWTRTMLDHCGLTDEPGPYAPHEAKRAVITSSVAQVRRPINREGLGVADPYRRHLRPFLDAYQAT